MDSFLSEIRDRLALEFKAESIEIVDFSAEHAGHTHGGHIPGHSVGTHIEVKLVSSLFAGQSRVNRERMIQKTLSPELLSGRIHALVLRLKSPEEL